MRKVSFAGGAWRIRTAVDGFADRCLSHSSKAPNKRVKSNARMNSFEYEVLFLQMRVQR